MYCAIEANEQEQMEHLFQIQTRRESYRYTQEWRLQEACVPILYNKLFVTEQSHMYKYTT